MVFESIVVEFLNRYLGDYFENLDTSQLKLGIWGGDAELKNLKLRASALDDLGPFKVVAGKLGSLTMKIPWTSLYSAPVVLILKDLHLLVMPSHSIKYDEAQEEKAANLLKQKEIERIELVRARELAKKQGPTKPEDDTFSEKMIAQIIKNVQIRIDSIHVRYEDVTSNVGHPFSFGVILKHLSVETTDKDWNPTIITEVVHIIHKKANLDGLSVYWNSNSVTLNTPNNTPNEMLAKMKEFIDNESSLTYILRPIVSEAKLKVVPNPDRGDAPFSLPKMLINVVMQELALGMTDSQFQDIMYLVEAIDFMYRSQYYRKYRPAVMEHTGHAKEWWKFAYRCVVEEEVRRRRLNWDWNHMKQHRELCKAYANAYYEKKISKKVKSEIEAKVAHCEKVLDIFNIMLVRKQVEVRLARKGAETAQTEQKGGWLSWSGWFGGGQAESSTTESGIAQKLEQALTAEEKKKLYQAIDYKENELPLDYPDDFEEYVLDFHLHTLKLIIREELRHVSTSGQILELIITDVLSNVRTRPVQSGLKVDMSLTDMNVVGLTKPGRQAPYILHRSINAEDDATKSLLKIEFENHPLNSTVDQRIVVRAEPVEIIYHAKTINEVVKCFSLPRSMQLSKLQAAAVSTLEEWKLQSASGLQYMLDQRGEVELDVDMTAPFLIVPQDGTLDTEGSVLIMNLGSIRVKSEPRRKSTTSSIGKHGFEEMKKQSYDKFFAHLRDFQIILALPGESYRGCLRKDGVAFKHDETDCKNSIMPSYLLDSKEFVVLIEQSLVQDDPRFEKLKVSATLPLMDVKIAEDRLLHLITLLFTLPFPKSEPIIDAEIRAKVEENPAVSESAAISRLTYTDAGSIGNEKKHESEVVEFTELVVSLGIESFKIRVTRCVSDKAWPLIEFELYNFESKMINKTFGMGIEGAIGGISVQAFEHTYPGIKGPLYILKTPKAEEHNKHLLNVEYYAFANDCPKHLASNVKERINVDVSSLDVILHLEALRRILDFTDDCLESINAATQLTAVDLDQVSVVSSVSRTKEPPATVTASKPEVEALTHTEETRKITKTRGDPMNILFQIDAHLDQLTVQFSSQAVNLVKIVLSKMDANYSKQLNNSTVSLELRDLNVLNLAANAIYKQLVTVDADKVVYIHVLMYDDGTSGQNYLDMNRYDMKVTVETGSPKIIYLGPVINDILTFIDAFQAAKEAVIEASNVAVDIAQEKVENVYTNVTRIVLNVSLQAPRIIIPRNEHTYDAWMADLGNLTVKNVFRKENISEFPQIVITDEMRVGLHNVKLSRILVDPKKGETKGEVNVLDPISIKVTVVRNLSSEWYHAIPSIKIDGDIKSCFVRMNNEDYSTILSSLSENLGAVGRLENAPPPAAKAPSSSTMAKTPRRKQSVSKKLKKDRSPRRVSSEPRTQEASKTESATKILVPYGEGDSGDYIDFEMNISIEKIALILYTGSSKLEEAKGLKKRDPSLAFADFAIQDVEIVLKMLNTGSMHVDITTQEIFLEDCRPGERVVTNLIRRKHETDGLMGTCMVRVTYKSEAEGSGHGPTLVIDTTSLIIVLCLDYLLQLSGFFVTSNPTVEAETGAKPEAAKAVEAPAPDNKKLESIIARTASENEAGESASKPLVNSKMFFNMAETEIVLVEDMENVHENALLLHCEISMKMVSNEEKSNMMGTIGNLSLSTCNFDVKQKYEKLAEVINPMSITIVMNTSLEVGTLIDLNISNIFIRLNAGTLELLLKISTGISLSNAPQEEEREVLNYKDLWNVKSLKKQDFWFLKPDVTVDVGTDVVNIEGEADHHPLFEVANDLVVRERLVLESGCIIITFEAGAGSTTMPLLLIESDIDFQVFDWSTKIQVAGRMKLEAAYYNTKYGLWEFLIEPIETRHHGRVSHQPWEMLFEYNTRLDQGKEREVVESKPYMGITLQSNEILEMSLSRPAMDILTILSEEFQAAAKSLITNRELITSPYTIVNELGTPIRLDLRNSPFACFRQGVTYDETVLNHGTSVNLGLLESFDMTKHYTSILREQEGRDERLLKLLIPEFDFATEIPVNRAEKRFYPLHKKTEFGESFGFLCDIAVKDCSKVLTIRAIVQIVNELPITVDIYCTDERDGVYKLMGSVDPKGTYNVPLAFLYTKTCELYFAPTGHKVSPFPFTWTALMKEIKTVSYLKSEHMQEGQSYHMKVVGEVRQTLFESTNKKTLASKCCYLYLRPPLVISNLLPVLIGYFTDDDGNVRFAKNGEQVTVTNIEIDAAEDFSLFIVIPTYQNHNWQARIQMKRSTEALSSWEFISEDKLQTMSLGVHKEIVQDNNLVMHIYCPYWMINRTGMDLYYRRDIKEEKPILFHHPQNHDAPVLFSFLGKAFFSKKKAFIRFKGSDWSEKFSLDVAGSSGTVTCKSPRQEYQVGLEVTLMSWGLTKTIIFSPRFYFVNQCPYLVKVQETQRHKEIDDSNVIELPSKCCLSFWPNLADPYLVVSIGQTKERTKLFKYEHAHHTLLQILNKYGGIHVDVHVTETSTVITFSEFVAGHAPALLVNATKDCSIEFAERGIPDGERIILPGCCQYIAWEDPMGQRTLEWSPITAGKKSSVVDKLHSDGTGRFTWVDDKNEEKDYFWVSFLDGLQRVLLFTDSEDLAIFLQAARTSDQVLSEYVIMFHGLGLSLVDSERGLEVFYMRIASSDITWQAAKPGKTKRFKPLNDAEIRGIEAAYQHYLNEKVISNSAKSHITLDSGLEVDFETSQILKPNPQELRRVFQTGIWVYYKNYAHANHFHAKLYRIQIDNQLPGAIFTVVLAPSAPPRRISETEEPLKPFAEVSIMQRITAHSLVTQYKYFKVLIQEFHIRADIGFINSIVEVFGQSTALKMEKMTEYFEKDYQEACTPVAEIFARRVVTQGQKHFYDFLHFSPLKIHLSFSMGSSSQTSSNFLNLLFQSIGVTLTEIQDVVFKLACLELQHEILSADQLYAELMNHYKSQAIKQLYVLVLGLDVIGNPYGLIMGVTEGVEAFFYEPIHGAIQGPGEFAEGLALGCKSLLGHTVGGVAGALSRVTGTLGKGVAALTLDDEFKQKRREMLAKRPHDVGEAFARSGKGLVMGFFDGITGVVAQPIKGAKDDGVEGFFKGFGKGTIGLFVRPVSGIVDFTSGSFEALKRVTSVMEDFHRLRPPRHIPLDSVVQPYIGHEAEGMQLLQELEKGKYATTDSYVAHALINPHAHMCVLLTNKRIFYVKRDEIFGGWTVVWGHLWEEFVGLPVIVEKGLKFRLKPVEKKCKLLRGKATEKDLMVHINNADVCTWILGKVNKALKFSSLMTGD